MAKPNENLKVLIVGAGFGGLTAAIECRVRGASVIVLESNKERRQLGDIISFGSNSGRIFKSWPGVEEALDYICHHSSGLDFRSFDDEFLCRQTWGAEAEWGKRFNGHRGEIHEIVWNHALSVGVEIRLGSKVSEYFETDTAAGVVVNGERFSADVVLAGDGVRSTARTIVLGFEDKPKSSGYAVYRAWMGTKKLKKNPLTAWLADPKIDHHVGWLGPDVHFLVATLQKGTACSWVLTHKVLCPHQIHVSLSNPPIGRRRRRRKLVRTRLHIRSHRRGSRLGPDRTLHHPRDPRGLPRRLETRLP